MHPNPRRELRDRWCIGGASVTAFALPRGKDGIAVVPMVRWRNTYSVRGGTWHGQVHRT